jgi:hypothetical protein
MNPPRMESTRLLERDVAEAEAEEVPKVFVDELEFLLRR